MAQLILPDEPVPVRLMNTVWADRAGVHDALTTPRDLRAWLAAVYPDQKSHGADLDRFRALRDALRRVAAYATDDRRADAAPAGSLTPAIVVINDAAALAPSWPQLVLRGGRLQSAAASAASPGDRLLSTIAGEAVGLLAAAVLRACGAPGCVLYFVRDHPRREWCSTACGNRARVARHYARHRHPTPVDR